jgi:secreted Zn-dependent insulinase-like peptidase
MRFRLAPTPAVLRDGVWRSAADPRTFSMTTLANGMRLFLAHDPRATTAACAVCVQVGSRADPPDVPGLAHMLEHAIFLGSDAFPGESELREFVRLRGGSCNASTSPDTTLYYVHVPSDALSGAVERLAAALAAPRLAPASVEREVDAVEAEFVKNLADDARREMLVLRALAEPDHPLARFTSGNRASLLGFAASGGDLHAQLRAFLNTHYSATAMTAALVAPLPLDTLERLAQATLAALPRLRTDSVPVPELESARTGHSRAP